MTRFEGNQLLLQEGDIITSKKGILFKDPLVKDGQGQIVHRIKYMGNGGWQVLESARYPREFVDMERVQG